MSRRKNNLPFIENLEIIDAGSEGKAVGRYNDRVVFVPFVVPGDVVDVQVYKKKKTYYQGKAVRIKKKSGLRVEPFCKHFGTCGGCKWQNLDYRDQLRFKQKQVEDNFKRIGKFEMPALNSIIPSKHTRYYRNKMEFTFSNHRWLTEEEKNGQPKDMNALGLFIPGFYDRVLDLEECYLQGHPSNAIRLEARNYAKENALSFYDVREWQGFLRNLVIRTASNGEVMVILVVNYYDEASITGMLNHLAGKFPEITSLLYMINNKKNDDLSDLEAHTFKGNPYIFEEMEGLKFKIGPLSFFQTNLEQAHELYKVARDFAGLTGDEVVYDLYTGTGTIANYLASQAEKVVGIEYIEPAIEDARENSSINGIDNTRFYAGDIVKLLSPEFTAKKGKPNVVITDPPRAGMHKNVIKQILAMAPQRVVYVSCNPATQARDITLMNEDYAVKRIQPVDMFPHTQHVENVTLLERR
ncbi:MAG: 23S rRNA (uracil(1939)-C(5))-methyltransferase RlmD [Bacteroidales bacterium]|nr:23S rRNA (uracil(1939)-C(5))-methyltransferase RlmD [Bacteroidales bacterium]